MSGNFLRVGIVADDKTTKGISSAKKNISTLDTSVKNLGKTFASVFATQKVIAFGRATVEAFMADQKSAALLANTVKNLGLAFATPEIEKFIASLSKASGITDDQLRPAMQKLLQTTGSIIRSQEILAQAIDVARASGVDLGTVVSDLSAAYVGNVKGLKKYALGLTQAELKVMTFAQLQKKLNEQFNGASAAYLETYAGKMAVLNTAAGEAKETIGKGLIDALAKVGGGTTVQDAANNLQSIANGINAITNAIGSLLGAGTKLYKVFDSISTLGGLLPTTGEAKALRARMDAAEAKRLAILSHSGRSSSPAGTWQRVQAQKKAETDAWKRAKQLAAAQTAQTKALKDQAALKKAQGVFDLQQIELVAALQGKISEQDKIRVEAQLALLNNNTVLATKLTNQIIAAQDPTGKLGQMLKDLGDTTVKDPFSAWVASLKAVNDQLALMKSLQAVTSASMPSTVMPAGSTTAGGFAYSDATPGVSGSNSQFGSGTPWAQAAQNFQVSVQLDGKQIASALANQSASGTSSFIDRNLGYFTN